MKKEKQVLEDKTQEIKKDAIVVPANNPTQPQLRQIILETDGTAIKLVKAEVASMIELQAILSIMLEALRKQ